MNTETAATAVFTKDEFAKALGVSRDSVHRAIHRGEIRAVRFGRRLLIPKTELERILAGNQEHGNGDGRS